MSFEESKNYYTASESMGTQLKLEDAELESTAEPEIHVSPARPAILMMLGDFFHTKKAETESNED